MSTSRKVNGSALCLFVYDSETAKYRTLAYATSHTLNISSEEESETSNKDDSLVIDDTGLWSVSKPNKLSYEITTDNLVAGDSSHGCSYWDLFDYMTANKSLQVVFGETLEAIVSSVDSVSVDYPSNGSWSTAENIVKDAEQKYKATVETSASGAASVNASVTYFKGTCTLSALNLTASTGDTASFSATLTGQGKLEKVVREVEISTTGEQ